MLYFTPVIKTPLHYLFAHDEINPEYADSFADGGVVFSASSDEGRRREILEYPANKFFIGVQYHPEFDSRPGFPEEIFSAFISSCAKR